MVALILAFRFLFCLDVIFPEYPEFTACITSDAFAHWSEDCFSGLKLPQSPSTKLMPSGLRFFNVNVKSLQSRLTLWDSMDCSLPGSSVHRILQARILEWVAILEIWTWENSVTSLLELWTVWGFSMSLIREWLRLYPSEKEVAPEIGKLRREALPWTHLSPATYSHSKAWFLTIWSTLKLERKEGREGERSVGREKRWETVVTERYHCEWFFFFSFMIFFVKVQKMKPLHKCSWSHASQTPHPGTWPKHPTHGGGESLVHEEKRLKSLSYFKAC